MTTPTVAEISRNIVVTTKDFHQTTMVTATYKPTGEHKSVTCASDKRLPACRQMLANALVNRIATRFEMNNLTMAFNE